MVKQLFILIILLCGPVAQQASKDQWAAYYDDSKNVIENEQVLYGFYAKLDSLLKNRNGKINVLHIGDSHIQADYFSGRMRKLMQQTFGNGGRGFVFPYQVARSNGPVDVGVVYDGGWSSSNIMKGYEGHTIGASGYALYAADSAELKINLRSYAANSSFNKLTIFQDGGHFELADSPAIRASALGGADYFPFSTYLLDDYQDSLVLLAHADEGRNMVLQGFNFENSEPGLVYHGMGTNGSSTLHYLRSDAFEKQMAVLQADLIIVSYGTNDAYLPYSRYCSSCAKDRFRRLIYRIRKHNPEAAILITSPPDHFYRRRYDNRNLHYLRRSLEKLAKEEGVAFWDLYSIMGGERSILEWQRAGLARGDLIHFSKQGYQLQGTLLYEALMNSFDGRFN